MLQTSVFSTCENDALSMNCGSMPRQGAKRSVRRGEAPAKTLEFGSWGVFSQQWAGSALTSVRSE